MIWKLVRYGTQSHTLKCKTWPKEKIQNIILKGWYFSYHHYLIITITYWCSLNFKWKKLISSTVYIIVYRVVLLICSECTVVQKFYHKMYDTLHLGRLTSQSGSLTTSRVISFCTLQLKAFSSLYFSVWFHSLAWFANYHTKKQMCIVQYCFDTIWYNLYTLLMMLILHNLIESLFVLTSTVYCSLKIVPAYFNK